MSRVCRVSVLILQQAFNITLVLSLISVGCTRYFKVIRIKSLPVTLGVHGSAVFHLSAANTEAFVHSHVVTVSQLLLFTVSWLAFVFPTSRLSDLVIRNSFHLAQTCERINYSRKSLLSGVAADRLWLITPLRRCCEATLQQRPLFNSSVLWACSDSPSRARSAI